MEPIGVLLSLNDLVDKLRLISQEAQKDSKVLHNFIVHFDEFWLLNVVVNNFDLLSSWVSFHKLIRPLESTFHLAFFCSQENGVS